MSAAGDGNDGAPKSSKGGIVSQAGRSTNLSTSLVRRVAQGVRYAVTGIGPNDWFGPSQPIQPVAQEQAEGRVLDYRTGYNLLQRPREETESGVTFHQLRAMSEACNFLRLVIETRKDQMEKLTWAIQPKLKVGQKPSDRQTSRQTDQRITQIEAFLHRPDASNNWTGWLRQLVEEILVTDAVAIYRRRTKGGKLYALQQLDGGTIKRVIDEQGLTPAPPSVAYQQILHGLAAVDYSADQLLYLPRNKRIHRLYGFSPTEQVVMTVNIAMRRSVAQLNYFCYSDDTEVLTRRGWLRFAECNADDEFATRQINTAIFEWQRAYDTFYKHYSGQMIHFTGRSVDVLVTPNHRMLVNSLPKKLGRHPARGEIEHVLTAEELMLHGTRNTGLPLTSHWVGTEIKGRTFRFDDTKTNKAKVVEMSGDDYCAFMGMYLAQGSLRKKGGIAIAQPPNGRTSHDVYRTLLTKLFGSVTYSGHQFEVCRVAVANHLRQFGKAWEKYIPEDIRNATPRQISIFLEYYLLGDGRHTAPGKVTNQALTVSRLFADHLTEVGQKAGYAPSVWTRPSGTAFVGDREVNKREAYLISFASMTATKGWHAELVEYDAPVACVCVPNKFLYVRRNGKALWSGNTEGNIPEALISCPPQWTAPQVKEMQEIFDDMLRGNLAERSGAKFIPGGTNVQFMKDALLKDDFDEWLVRIICYAFSVSPTPFTKQTNRATAESVHQAALQEGLFPLQNWVKALIDRVLIEDFEAPDLEFTWNVDPAIDPAQAMAINTGYVAAGLKTRNEVRSELGLDPIPDGDEVTITAGNTVTRLSDALTINQAPDEPAASAGALPGEKPEGEQHPPPKPVKKVDDSPSDESNEPVTSDSDLDEQKMASLLAALFKNMRDVVAAKIGAADVKFSDVVAEIDAVETAGAFDMERAYQPVKVLLEHRAAEAGETELRRLTANVSADTVAAGAKTYVNQDAINYAQNRAAELIGKKVVDGNLVNNPDAKWALRENERAVAANSSSETSQAGFQMDQM